MTDLLLLLLALVALLGLLYYGSSKKSESNEPKILRTGFTQLERKLLDELRSICSHELLQKIDSQVQYFDHTKKWREYWNESMTLELYEEESNLLPDANRYMRKDEFIMARLQYKLGEVKHTVEFSSFNGRIWGMEIIPNPVSIDSIGEMEVISKKFLVEPDHTPGLVALKTAKKSQSEKPVRSKTTGYKPERVVIKTSGNRFEMIEIDLNTKLPASYLNFIKKLGSLEFGSYRIFGVSDIRLVRQKMGRYYVLAEFEDGILMVRENEHNGMIYYQNFNDDETPEEVGTNFEKAFADRILNMKAAVS